MKTREQKQVDAEELEVYLKSSVSDRDKTMSSSRGVGALGFFKDKMNDIKGVDSELARQYRLEKLAVKITDLQNALAMSRDCCEKFGVQVENEITQFYIETSRDLKSIFEKRVSSEIAYHKKCADLWQEIVKLLED